MKSVVLTLLMLVSLTANAGPQECTGGVYVIESYYGADGRTFILAINADDYGSGANVGGDWGAVIITGKFGAEVKALVDTNQVVCVLDGSLSGKYNEILSINAYKIIGTLREYLVWKDQEDPQLPL